MLALMLVMPLMANAARWVDAGIVAIPTCQLVVRCVAVPVGWDRDRPLPAGCVPVGGVCITASLVSGAEVDGCVSNDDRSYIILAEAGETILV